MRIVALEEHWAAPDLLSRIPVDALTNLGWPPRDRLPSHMSRFAELSDAGGMRLADMDLAGIEMQVLSAGGPGADLLDGVRGSLFAREYNERLSKLVSDQPERFCGFAHLPMSDPEAAADELEHAVTTLGLRGAMINGTTGGRFLDDPCFEPILARAEKLLVPLYLHPGLPPEPVRRAYYSELPDEAGLLLSGPGLGWHAEIAVQVLRMALSGTLDRHPNLRLIAGHMGEGLPMMMGRIEDIFGSFAARHLQRPVPQMILDQLWITTSGFFTLAPFMAAQLTFGADRIMFAVDYPFSDNQRATEFLRKLPVSGADRLKIAHANADRLLGFAG